MKILRLYYKLPPMKGGMEKHIYFLTKFQNISDEVTVFFNQGDAISSNDEKILPCIKLYKIKPLFIGVFIFYFLIIFKLLFNRKKFDSIHIHGDWSALVFIRIIKKLTQAKIVAFTSHGLITNSYTHRKFLPMSLQNVDLIFTTGHESAGIVQKMVNKQVIIQPSGINNIFFKASEKHFENDKFTLVTVANLVPVKNINLILEIAKNLPDIKFLIVGEGPEKEMHENAIKSNKLKNVKLVGFKSPVEIKKIYNESDCFLLTSLAEGTPTSALEAMTSGLPIVASNAGGLNNIVIDCINGFVIDNYEIKNYVDKIKLIRDNIELRKTIYHNNKEISENFRWDKVAHRITSLIKECMNDKN
jgi:glycosyltransferase involved in cell wall biosynthesis